jgi:hypothetical protein
LEDSVLQARPVMLGLRGLRAKTGLRVKTGLQVKTGHQARKGLQVKMGLQARKGPQARKGLRVKMGRMAVREHPGRMGRMGQVRLLPHPLRSLAPLRRLVPLLPRHRLPVPLRPRLLVILSRQKAQN